MVSTLVEVPAQSEASIAPKLPDLLPDISTTLFILIVSSITLAAVLTIGLYISVFSRSLASSRIQAIKSLREPPALRLDHSTMASASSCTTPLLSSFTTETANGASNLRPATSSSTLSDTTTVDNQDSAIGIFSRVQRNSTSCVRLLHQAGTRVMHLSQFISFVVNRLAIYIVTLTRDAADEQDLVIQMARNGLDEE